MKNNTQQKQNAKNLSHKIHPKIIVFFFCACLFGVSYGTQASAATSIYRSVGPGATTALATGASNTLSIATSTATFASALPDNIGVGDVIQYDSDNNGTIDVIAFIHGRTSSTVYTVKTASGGTPTATTADDNDWSIFRAYISLGNAEAGIENTGIASGVRNFDTFSDSTGRNLVTADEWWNITVYAGQDGMADTSATIANWTTDATHYIKIYTPYDSTEVGTSQRHLGKLDTQKYYINTTATGNYSNNINVQQDYTRIEGLQTQMNTGGFSFISGIVLNATGGMLDAMIVKGVLDGGNFSYGGIYMNSASVTAEVRNSVIYGFSGSSNSVSIWGRSMTTLDIYNTVVYGGSTGIGMQRTAGTMTVTNSAVLSTGDDFNGTMTITTSASDDIDTVIHPADWNTVFIDYANRDFRLRSTDAELKDQGTDLTAEGFTNDIHSETRSGSWDIGADEYTGVNNITLGGLIADNASTTGFDIATDFIGDANADATLTAYYCNDTDTADCDPTSGSSVAMSRGTGVYTVIISGLTAPNDPGDTLNVRVIGTDTDGIANSPLNTTIALGIPPVRSNDYPDGVLPAGTTSTDLELTTDENATCKYSTSSGVAYASMTNTFTTTGTTSHTTTVSGLTDGSTYNYYIRCEDSIGNANIDDYTTTFSVAIKPTISGVSGTIDDGETLTITGANFGASGPSIILFDSFSGTPGEEIPLTGAQIGAWSDSPSVENPLFVSDVGTNVAAKLIDADVTKNLNIGFPAVTEFFTAYKVKIPDGCNFPHADTPETFPDGSQWKLTWIYDNSLPYGYAGNDDLTIPTWGNGTNFSIAGNDSGISGGGSVGVGQPGTASNWFSFGEWNRFSTYLKGGEVPEIDPGIIWAQGMSPTLGSHIFGYYRDRTIFDGDDNDNDDDVSRWTIFNAPGWHRSLIDGVPNPTICAYYDDIYVATGANAVARVEVGDNADYTANTKLAIALPTVLNSPFVWADGSLQATFRQDEFADGATVYVFVTNADGEVNATGYPITIATGPDTTDPTVTAFTIPATASSLIVAVDSFTATDDTSVTGYLINESASVPTSGDAGWVGTAPTEYVFTTEGSKTLYAWAKDAAGNVSTSLNDSVVVTLPVAETPPDDDDDVEEDVDALDIFKVKYRIVNRHQVRVTFKTNNDARSVVRYGIDKNIKKHKKEMFYRKNKEKHKVNLKKLIPGATYYFRISAKDTHEQTARTRIHKFVMPK